MSNLLSKNPAVYAYMHSSKKTFTELSLGEEVDVLVKPQTVIVEGSENIPEFCWAIGEEDNGTKRKVSLLQLEKMYPRSVQRRRSLGGGYEIVVLTSLWVRLTGTQYDKKNWTKVTKVELA